MFIFKDDNFHRSMPYLFEGNKLFFSQSPKGSFLIEDQKKTVCDLGTETYYYPYQLQMCDFDNGKVTNQLKVFDDSANVHCNAGAYRHKQGNIVLNVTIENIEGLGFNSYQNYKIRNLEGLSNTKQLVKNTLGLKPYSVAENQIYRAVANVKNKRCFLLLFNKKTGLEQKISFIGIDFLRRISFIDRTNCLCLSSPNLYDSYFYDANILNVENLNIKKVETEHKSIYKFTIYDKMIVYTVKGKDRDKYSRDLFYSDYELRKSQVKSKVDSSFKRF